MCLEVNMFLQEVKIRLEEIREISKFLKSDAFATFRQKKTNYTIFRIKFSS